MCCDDVPPAATGRDVSVAVWRSQFGGRVVGWVLLRTKHRVRSSCGTFGVTFFFAVALHVRPLKAFKNLKRRDPSVRNL